MVNLVSKKENSLSIAIMGTRGIPARYGGFETFAEELSKRLAERGHAVTVYCRRRFFAASGDTSFGKVSLRYAPTLMQKYLETPLNALTSFLDLFRCSFDVVLLCNAANSPFAWLIRMRGVPFCINVDGIERERAKWNFLGRLWYRLGEISSVLFASKVVGDAEVICAYYRKRYKCAPIMIPYGAHAVKKEPGATLKSFGLSPKKYILYVSRLEPENNALGVIEAYCSVKMDIPLVIVGDAPYAEEYKRKLKAAADPRVIFTGYQFGEAYQELQSNALLYIQATEVGGTHPALIEAMAYGNCVIANGTPENIEVLGDAGLIYQKNNFEELSGMIQGMIDNPDEIAKCGKLASERARQRFSWDAVTEEYEKLFLSIARPS